MDFVLLNVKKQAQLLRCFCIFILFFVNGVLDFKKGGREHLMELKEWLVVQGLEHSYENNLQLSTIVGLDY